MSDRHCADCTLCCKLLPLKKGTDQQYPEMHAVFGVPGMLPEWNKAAGERCQHQRHHTGCAVYDKRPLCCRMWSCRWLVNNDTADLRRPDRAGYVIDMVPDFVRLGSEAGEITVQVVQVWVDPKRPGAWREDDALRAYIERRAAEGIATLVRLNARDAIGVFAPALAGDGQWHLITDGCVVEERSTWPGRQPRGIPVAEA
jgi:hypothetical protein